MPKNAAADRRRSITRAVAAVLMLCCTLSSSEMLSAATPPSPFSVNAAYEALKSALRQSDIESLSAILAPDFTEESPDGSLEARDAYLKDESESASSLTLSSVVIDHEEIETTQTRAIAKATYTVTGSETGNGNAETVQTNHADDG